MTSKQKKKAQCLSGNQAKSSTCSSQTPKTFVFTLSFLPSEEETSAASQIQRAVATCAEN